MKRVIIAIMLIVAAAVPAAAGSLWDSTSDSLFTDKKALFVGDIVTIVVNENTKATQNGATTIAQSEKMAAGDGLGVLGKFLNKFGVESSDEYSADGSTKSGSTLSTSISAEVMEVLPNGNLIIEARRSMVVNAETQTMVLSGVIRPADVSRTNLVGSAKVSNLNIRYEGKGPIAKRQKAGVLNKMFDLLF